jgi:hypothetical protein
MQARLLDSTRPLVERHSAMSSLRALRNTQGPTTDADFVRPLASMAQVEPDDRLRLDAVTLLATDFSNDVDARAALERIASSDRNMLVRKVAERATSGSIPWRSYAVATARDAGLPVQQRLAPLSWMVDASQREDLVAVVSELLDGVSPIAQDPLLPVDVADLGLALCSVVEATVRCDETQGAAESTDVDGAVALRSNLNGQHQLFFSVPECYVRHLFPFLALRYLIRGLR